MVILLSRPGKNPFGLSLSKDKDRFRAPFHGSTTAPRTGARGFTYLGLLFAIVLFGIVLATAGVVWHTAARREKEAELLFVGEQYQRAIVSYHAISVNGQNQFPRSLDDLLEDHRFPMPVRHLRKRHIDPVTHQAEWGLVRSGEMIMGIYSLAEEEPLKKAGFGACCANFNAAQHYADWKFVYREDLNLAFAAEALVKPNK